MDTSCNLLNYKYYDKLLLILTFELFFGGNFWTTTPIVTQSPSISSFPLIFVGICEIFTIFRPSILFSIITDEINGLTILNPENFSFKNLSSSDVVLVLVTSSSAPYFVVDPRPLTGSFCFPLGPRLPATFEPLGSRPSEDFLFTVDGYSEDFCFAEL